MTTLTTWTERSGNIALALMLASLVAGMVGFLTH